MTKRELIDALANLPDDAEITSACCVTHEYSHPIDDLEVAGPTGALRTNESANFNSYTGARIPRWDEEA